MNIFMCMNVGAHIPLQRTTCKFSLLTMGLLGIKSGYQTWQQLSSLILSTNPKIGIYTFSKRLWMASFAGICYEEKVVYFSNISNRPSGVLLDPWAQKGKVSNDHYDKRSDPNNNRKVRKCLQAPVLQETTLGT